MFIAVQGHAGLGPFRIGLSILLTAWRFARQMRNAPGSAICALVWALRNLTDMSIAEFIILLRRVPAAFNSAHVLAAGW